MEGIGNWKAAYHVWTIGLTLGENSSGTESKYRSVMFGPKVKEGQTVQTAQLRTNQQDPHNDFDKTQISDELKQVPEWDKVISFQLAGFVFESALSVSTFSIDVGS